MTKQYQINRKHLQLSQECTPISANDLNMEIDIDYNMIILAKVDLEIRLDYRMERFKN